MTETEAVGQSGAALGWADVGSTMVMLLVVLAVIIGLSFLVRRLNERLPTQRNAIKVLSATSVGAKERLLIVEIGEQKLLLGVTQQSIQLLQTLPDDFKVGSNDNTTSSVAQQVLSSLRRDR